MLQAKRNSVVEWTTSCKSYSLTNSFRKNLYGRYYSTTLPAYIPTTDCAAQDDWWKKILSKPILVRNSHEVAARQSAKAAIHDQFPLMKASGLMAH